MGGGGGFPMPHVELRNWQSQLSHVSVAKKMSHVTIIFIPSCRVIKALYVARRMTMSRVEYSDPDGETHTLILVDFR